MNNNESHTQSPGSINDFADAHPAMPHAELTAEYSAKLAEYKQSLPNFGRVAISPDLIEDSEQG